MDHLETLIFKNPKSLKSETLLVHLQRHKTSIKKYKGINTFIQQNYKLTSEDTQK